MTEQFIDISKKIPSCMAGDQFKFKRKLKQLTELQKKAKPFEKSLDQLAQQIEQSAELLAFKKTHKPAAINFPTELPIAGKREAIAKAINENQVVIIAGETGSGKTTQLPKICLELGRGINGVIGHTQPRRLAARTVAQRIADELETPLGEGVGYQVRFNDQVAPHSYIKLMTDGILLAEIQRDKFLNQYDTIIIDEAHERSLNIDFLLGFLKNLLPKRPDLKIIITSATIDLERFSRHFNNAPIIEVSGRTYPVEVLYRPLDEGDEDLSLAEGVERAIQELVDLDQRRGGDILVFLSGEADIRQVSKHLRDRQIRGIEVLPLYARLSNREQNKIFDLKLRTQRRVVLATNVAETSLTVPGIHYVIDSGKARISRYSFRTKIQRLPIESISQASANQRKGRCGRVTDGICIRLYDESDFDRRPEFTDPEILRTNLASVILQLLSMGVNDIDHFPFIDAPDRRMINDGFKLLEELAAVNAKKQLTALGKTLAFFPVDPRMGRILLAANKSGCLQEALIIVSALTVQDPRERPADKQQQADEKHRVHWHEESDFLSYLNLWNHYEQQRQELSQNQLRKYCLKHFLSFMRMREWRDIHYQLRLACKHSNLKENQQPANYEQIHQALLTGLMSHIAVHDNAREYNGARNRKLQIFPGSALVGRKKKTPKWIVAAEIAETSQVFARCCARIEPEWLLGINDQLLKPNYTEPHWQQKTGRVMAFETLSLYGLQIRNRQRVHYGPVDTILSRELFIRGALIAGQCFSKLPLLQKNQQLIKEVVELEEKSRRRDILVDDDVLFAFFNARLPTHITTLKTFEHWCKKNNSDSLLLDKQLLINSQANLASEQQFPDRLRSGDLELTLEYKFEPGNIADGVTVKIPLALLNRAPQHRFEWLVPGLLREKCIALVKALPKSMRKQLVPVPDFVDKALLNMQVDDKPLLEVLAKQLLRLSGMRIENEDWQVEQLDDFYRMNIAVIDDRAKVLGQGRDLQVLQEQFKGQVSASVNIKVEHKIERSNITEWNFDELPTEVSFEQAGVKVTSYPALIDYEDHVAIELKDFAEEATLANKQGLIRLLILSMNKEVKSYRQSLLKSNNINLQLAGISQRRDDWVEQMIQSVFYEVFLEGQEQPVTQQDFQNLINKNKSKLESKMAEATQLMGQIASECTAVRKALKTANHLSMAASVADINDQLARLLSSGFIVDTPWQYLKHFPRYLKAIVRRIELLRGNVTKDKQHTHVLNFLSTTLDEKWQGNSKAQLISEALLDYRWQIEELRVSFFAQQLGTAHPVSEKRLKKAQNELKQLLVANKV